MCITRLFYIQPIPLSSTAAAEALLSRSSMASKFAAARGSPTPYSATAAAVGVAWRAGDGTGGGRGGYSYISSTL